MMKQLMVLILILIVVLERLCDFFQNSERFLLLRSGLARVVAGQTLRGGRGMFLCLWSELDRKLHRLRQTHGGALHPRTIFLMQLLEALQNDSFGLLGIGRKAFGIDDDGNFYLSSYHNGYNDTSYGIGVTQIYRCLRVGITCKYWNIPVKFL